MSLLGKQSRNGTLLFLLNRFIVIIICGNSVAIWKNHCSETIVILCKFFSDTFTKCCSHCNHDVQNVVEHLFTTCQSLFEQRSLLYSLFIQEWGIDTIRNFFNLSSRMKVISLLTGMNVVNQNENKNIEFICKPVRHITYR